MRSAVRRTLAGLLAVTVLAVTGCGGGDDDDPILIGISLPLTGATSQLGQSVQKGYKAWEKVINDDGGMLGRPVKLVIKDDADNQNTVVADYNALISRDNVDFVFGTFSTRLALGAVEIVDRNQMLYLDPAGAAPEMFARNSPLYFYTEPAPPEEFGTPYANYLVSLDDDARPTTAAYVLTEDPFTRSTVGGMRTTLEEAGIETVVDETFPVGTQNFDPTAVRIAQEKAEVVITAGEFNSEVGLIRSLIKAGASPRFLYENNAPDEPVEFPDAVGSEATQGAVSATGYAPSFRTEANEEFLKAYADLNSGEEPASLAAFAFGTGQVLAAALEAVGEVGVEDQAQLADWLHENAVQTVSGELTWDAQGRPQGEFGTLQWQDGEQQLILPATLATTDTVLNCWRTCTAADRHTPSG